MWAQSQRMWVRELGLVADNVGRDGTCSQVRRPMFSGRYTYRVAAVHPKLGTRTVEIAIQDGEIRAIELTFESGPSQEQ